MKSEFVELILKIPSFVYGVSLITVGKQRNVPCLIRAGRGFPDLALKKHRVRQRRTQLMKN